MKITVLTGIDGTGKSTFMNQLYRELPTDGRLKLISCPYYHSLPGSGIEEISRLFSAINLFGNEHQQADIKALGLFLQMSLYNKAIQFISSENNHPELVISERHPLIDTFVYAALYVPFLKGIEQSSNLERQLLNELSELQPYALQHIVSQIENTLPETTPLKSMSEYCAYLKRLFSKPLPDIFKQLKTSFELNLPNRIIFIDLDPSQALERLQQSNKQLEIHESSSRLTALRKAYLMFFNFLKQEHPEIKVEITQVASYSELKNLVLESY